MRFPSRLILQSRITNPTSGRGNVLDVPSPGGIRVLCGSTDVGSAGLRWSATEVAGQIQTVCGNGGTLPTPGIRHCHTFVWPEISTRQRDVFDSRRADRLQGGGLQLNGIAVGFVASPTAGPTTKVVNTWWWGQPAQSYVRRGNALDVPSPGGIRVLC